jgi:hypothetical protein
MTEKVLFNFTDGFTGGVGDGSAPYTEEEFRGYNDAFLNGEEANAGVVAGIDNELEVTVTAGSPDTVQVASGRAIVHGFPYFSDASVDLGAPSGSGNRAGYVIIRVNRTSANSPPNEDEGRLRFLMSATTTLPLLTQDSAVTWDIPLASFAVDVSDDIYTDATFSTLGVTDTRQFVISPLSRTNLIAEQIVTVATNPITFSNIPAIYRHLQVMIIARSDVVATTDTLNLTLNNDTGSNYYYLRLNYDDTTVDAIGQAGVTNVSILNGVAGSTAVANGASIMIIDIPFYTNTQFNKSGKCRLSNPVSGVAAALIGFLYEWWWLDTSKVNRIDLTLVSGNFDVGSHVLLYGSF